MTLADIVADLQCDFVQYCGASQGPRLDFLKRKLYQMVASSVLARPWKLGKGVFIVGVLSITECTKNHRYRTRRAWARASQNVSVERTECLSMLKNRGWSILSCLFGSKERTECLGKVRETGWRNQGIASRSHFRVLPMLCGARVEPGWSQGVIMFNLHEF